MWNNWKFILNCQSIIIIIAGSLESTYLNIYINLSLGAYDPLTSDGNIIVDGILASCYASFDHDLAHISMKPMQWSPNIIQQIFGEEDRFSAFTQTIKELGKWLLPYGQLLQYWYLTLKITTFIPKIYLKICKLNTIIYT